MDDGDHEGPHTALHNNPRFLVATTLATLVIAGSAYIWRSNPRLLLLDSHQRGEHPHRDPDSDRVTADNKSAGPETSNVGVVSSKETAAGSTVAPNDELGNHGDGKDSKNSRSKERRRRGKDPLKEMLKGGKKVKGVGKPSRVDDAEDSDIGPSTPFLHTSEPARFSHSRGTSMATSSRSVSTTSHSNHRTSPPQPDWASSQGDHDDEHPASSSTSLVSGSLGTGSQASLFVVETSDHLGPGLPSTSRDTDPPLQPRTPEFPNIPLSTSSSTSHTSSVFSSNSGITPNTSPTLSLSEKTPTLTQTNPSSSPLPHASSSSVSSSVSSPSIQQVQKAPGPWDWDGAGPNPSPDPIRKPPRFRSKSKGSGSTPISTAVPSSPTSTTASSESHPTFSDANTPPTTSTAISPSSVGSHDDVSLPFTFPTLNAAPGAFSGSPVSPVPNQIVNSITSTGSGGGINGNGSAYGNGSGSTPRRAPTPRCPPTSGTNTPPPLSAQTQLASLRGALEAARMREEKTKIDMERYIKDLEMMRWENTAARRRELELQAQVHHLMHQLQTYATAFATVSGQPSPIPQHHNPAGNSNTNGSPSPSQNGYHFPPSSASVPHSPPMHLQIPSPAQMLGMLSPTMLSPVSMSHSGPHSPFYPYSSHSPLAHHSHSHLQQSQSSHQPNIYSMMFAHVPGTSGTGSGPSSAAGSSVGSHSPDQSGSPSPASSSLDRGKRRRTPRTQTSGTRINEHGSVWEENEGDIEENDVNGERRADDDYTDGSDSEQVNEFLAGAILKRPESIRSLSSKKGKVKATEVQEHAEFTFPSLSNFGSSIRQHSAPIDILEDDVAGLTAADDPEPNGVEIEDSDKTVEEVTPPAVPPPMPELLGPPHQEDPH